MRGTIVIAVVIAVLAFGGVADAFCGFYVGGADAKLFNDATQVVLMRTGQRTVLSMQNAYKGPPEAFAMVVPVPVVLQQENVKTLPREVFARVDSLTAPRLVEYWEEDPCYKPPPPESGGCGLGCGGAMKMPMSPSMAGAPRDYGVRVEAQFVVGEYEIVILSAQDAAGLEAWLHDNKYTIPQGAEQYLRPYVQSGSKFFVAKVDPQKVKFDESQHAMLSPLRFHYDADTFTLPIRLGLINSSGTQDLIVNIIAKERYEAANYPNVTIPTNLAVAEEAAADFGAMYAALFDATLAKHPKAVVTEYSWSAASCDPCPTPPLGPEEIAVLGGDLAREEERDSYRYGYGFVVTRLHARYSKDALGDDLVFKPAPPITGGRGVPGEAVELQKGAARADSNDFQGRYIIRHWWTGPVECSDPIFERWGGPPNGSGPRSATNIAFAARGKTQIAALVREDVPEIGLTSTSRAAARPPMRPVPRGGGCAGCAIGGRGGNAAIALAAIAIAVLVARRRSR